jgi:hypothetical protein
LVCLFFLFSRLQKKAHRLVLTSKRACCMVHEQC